MKKKMRVMHIPYLLQIFNVFLTLTVVIQILSKQALRKNTQCLSNKTFEIRLTNYLKVTSPKML